MSALINNVASAAKQSIEQTKSVSNLAEDLSDVELFLKFTKSVQDSTQAIL